MLKKTQLTSMELIVELIKPALEQGKSAKFAIVGNSMNPVFRNSVDNVVVSSPDNVKNHDVILYRREDGDYVLHRIVGVGKEGYKLCGDNQTVIEYPVKKEDVIAVATAFERKGKTITKKTLWYGCFVWLWCVSIKLRPLLLPIIYRLKNIGK